MWKKLLAVAAVVMTLASSTASALVVAPGGSPAGAAVITNLAVTPASFDASKGETAAVTFGLSATSSVYAYALNKSTSEIATVFANRVNTLQGNVTYTFTGRSGNTVLADGTYVVKVFTYDAQGAQTGFDSEEVTIATVVVQNANAPKITGLEADPASFDPSNNEDTEVSFDVDKDGYLTVVIKKGLTTVKTFADYDGNDFYRSSEDHSINWNGTDVDGTKVATGVYKVYVTARNDSGENTVTSEVVVAPAGVSSSGVIKDVTLTPSANWDPTDEELEIDFELTESVKSLVIEAKKGNKVVEITDDDFADDDDYEETWDGTDEDGDYIDQGVWEITVRADGDKVTKTVSVSYGDPKVTEAFVTKSSFDPSADETTTLVFKLEEAAEVTVEVYKGSKRELKLLDEESVSKNRWYAVTFDGMDEDGEEVTFGSDWKFKLTAENATDNDIVQVQTVEFDVQDDDVSDNKSNVTMDMMSPAAFDDEQMSDLVLSYDIDENAEVFAAIYEGNSTGGEAEIELMDYVDQDSGYHTIQWDGRDEDGKKLKDGLYTYKLITKASGNHKETEIGQFAIGNAGDIDDVIGDDDDDTPEPADCEVYWDLSNLDNNEMCMAIEWVTNEGIFGGYTDGSFKPYTSINRAEMLKVLFKAFENEVTLLPADGTTQGFKDVEPTAWYMPYVRTAKFYGMLYGYNNGLEARLESKVLRVEALKFALEASEAFTNYTIKPYSYIYYADVDVNDADQKWFLNYVSEAYNMILLSERYDSQSGKYFIEPFDEMQRGEVALLLYRMANHNLLGAKSTSGWTQTGGDYGYNMGY